jgi:hypothetical protein
LIADSKQRTAKALVGLEQEQSQRLSGPMVGHFGRKNPDKSGVSERDAVNAVLNALV